MITDETGRALLSEAYAQGVARIDPVPPSPPSIDLDQLRAEIRASIAQAEEDLRNSPPPLTDDQVWWIRQRLMLNWR